MLNERVKSFDSKQFDEPNFIYEKVRHPLNESGLSTT